MEQTYWLKRQRSALAMARGAGAAATRLIHYDLAGRYSIMAAQSVSARLGKAVEMPLPARIGQGPSAVPVLQEAAR